LSGVLQVPAFDLSAPGSIIYDGRLAARGMRVNRFGFGMKKAENRAAFKTDPDRCLVMSDLTDEERARIRARDWAWLLEKGGHIQALARIAATDGQYLFHIAAHSCGVDAETLMAACPRHVSGLGKIDG
jgi:protocatechuate 4,5-dioxygenase, alpha chain